MIPCAISEDNKRRLFNYVYKLLADKLVPFYELFDPKEITSSIYNTLTKGGKTQEEAYSYTQLVPQFMLNILGRYPVLAKELRQRGLSLDKIAEMSDKYLQSLDNVAADLEKADGTISDIEQQIRISDRVAYQSGSGVSSYEETPEPFHPNAVNAQSSKGWKVLPGFVQNPATALMEEFQKKTVLEVLTKGDSTKLDNPLYLTAMLSSEIPGSILPPGDIVYAITDQNGKLHLENGQHMYYPSREVTKSGKSYTSKPDLAPISAIIKSKLNNGEVINTKQAEDIRNEQLKQMYDINKYIQKNKKSLSLIIDGGTLGYPKYDLAHKTPLSELKTSIFIDIQDGEKGPFHDGAAYFRVKGLADPIILQRNPMPPELIEKIISTISDPINNSYASKTYPLTTSERLQLIKQYLYNDKYGRFKIDDDEGLRISLDGRVVDPSDKKTISDFFNNYSPTPGFKESNLKEKQKDNAINGDEPGFESKLYQGAVVSRKDSQGNTYYQRYTKPTFNISAYYKNHPDQFNDYVLEKQSDGSLLLKSDPTGTDYLTWLGKNTYINYKLNKDGQLVALSSYFTFKPTEDSLNKLYPVEKHTQTIKSIQQEITDHGSAKSLSIDEATRAFIEKVRREGLRKEVPGIEATLKQQQEIKKWYDKHPLSKYFPYKAMFDVINSDHIAQWTADGITLKYGSDYSDLAHEAWHGFTQGFLSPDQKTDLYNEARKMSGSFTTETGNKILFKKASYYDIEQLLGEDFRKYILSDGKLVLGKRPIRNTIFRKIYSFLKTLFGNTTYAQNLIDQNALNTIKDLYDKMRVGNLNEYTFSADNITFNTLNKTGVLALKKTDELDSLNPDDSLLARQTLDSIFSSLPDEYNNIAGEYGKLTSHIYSTAKGRKYLYEAAKKKLVSKRDQFDLQSQWNELELSKDQTRTLYERIKKLNGYSRYQGKNIEFNKASDQEIKDWLGESLKGKVPELIRNVSLLNYLLKNFGDINDPFGKKSEDGLIAYHNRKSAFLSFEDKFTPDQDNNLSDISNFKDGNETTIYEGGRPEILYLMKSLHLKEKGETVLNRLEFPLPVEYQQTMKRTALLLADSLSPQEMFETLEKNRDKYPFISQLLGKLTNPDNPDIFIQETWSDFFQTFNRAYVEQIKNITEKKISPEGRITYDALVGTGSAGHKEIQRRWEDKFKMGQVKSDFITWSDRTGPILNIDKVLTKYPNVNKNNLLRFLNDIGVDIDSSNLEIQREVDTNPKFFRMGLYLRKRLEFLKKEYKEPVSSLFTIFREKIKGKDNEAGNYDLLAKLQDKYSDSYTSLMVTTAADQSRSILSLNNSMTVTKNIINNVRDSAQLSNELPHLDILRSPFYNYSKTREALFDKQNFRNDIKYLVENLDGTEFIQDGEHLNGVSSSNADSGVKMSQDIAMLYFRGLIENQRHGDKNTSISSRPQLYNTPYSIDKKMWFGPENFKPGDISVYRKIYESVTPYLYAEQERVLIMRTLKPGDANLNNPQYVKNGKNLVIFDDMPKYLKDQIENLNEPLIQVLDKNTKESNKLSSDIDSYLRQYWDKTFDDAIREYNKAPFIADSIIKFVTETKRFGQDNPLANIPRREIEVVLVKGLVFNSWIHNVEQYGINYGDPAQHKTWLDPNKRYSMFSSSGDIHRTDDAVLFHVNQMIEPGYAEQNGYKKMEFTKYLPTAVLEDPMDGRVSSVYHPEIEDQIKKATQKQWDKKKLSYTSEQLDDEAKRQADPYKEMKIGDGMGWIEPDTYRALAETIGRKKWSSVQEDLFQKEAKGEVIDPRDVTEYFPPNKSQYAGFLSTDKGLPVSAGHKFMLARMDPSFFEEFPNMKVLYQRMNQSNVGYSLLKSASKITNITDQGVQDKLYSDWDKRSVDDKPLTHNTIDLRYLKEQQHVNEKFKGKVIISTQFRKNIIDSLVENGVPTDISMSMNKWDALSENEKIDMSPKYTLYRDFELAQDRLTEGKKQELIREIGWDKPENYAKVNQRLIDIITEALSKKDISDSELKDIELVRELGQDVLKYNDLSIHLSASDIEKKLVSLVNSRIVRQKMNGESLAQVTSVLFETKEFINMTPEERKSHGTNGLRFYQYRENKPTLPSQCMIALQGDFLHLLEHPDVLKLAEKQDIIDEAARLKFIPEHVALNKLIKDESWLDKDDHRRMITLVDTRIPNQSLNSTGFHEIYHFLHPKAGNIIVVPAEIVIQSSSDFDYDKLPTMMPNIRKDKEGNIILYKNYTKDETNKLYDLYKEEQVTKSINENAPDDDKAELNKEDIQASSKLMKAIFGERRYQDDINEEFKELIGEGKVKTFDEFFKNLNSNTKATENDLMWSMKKILEHPDNYSNLVRPNSTSTLDPIADEIKNHVIDYNPDHRIFPGSEEMSPSRLSEYMFNLYMHQLNKVGGESLAIAAVDITFGNLLRRVGAYMNTSYIDRSSKTPEKLGLPKKIELFLPHNTVNIDGINHISLSHTTDAKGKYLISDNTSQIVNMELDVAKNPRALYLQLNKEAIPTILFLNMAGVPIDHIIYLASQPVIRQYMDKFRERKSPLSDPLGVSPGNPNFAQMAARTAMLIDPTLGFDLNTLKIPYNNTRSKVGIEKLYNLMAELYQNLPKNTDNYSIAFDKNRLKNKILTDNKTITTEERLVLLHWWEIEELAKSVKDIKLNLNPDTKKSNTAYMSMTRAQKLSMIDSRKMLAPHIVSKLLTESPISSFGTIGDFTLDFLRPLFSIRTDKTIQRFLESKLASFDSKESIEEIFGDLDKFPTKFYNTLVSYVFQNKLRSFDLAHIREYRNLTSKKAIDVKQLSYLKQGVAVDNGILHYDSDILRNDFVNKSFTNKSYTDRGLATVNPKAFMNAYEFYNFVFEREYIRASTELSDVSSDPEYKILLAKNRGDEKLSYEEYIRDRALENIGNGWKLFYTKDNRTYAAQVVDTIADHKLYEKYPLIKALVMSGTNIMQNLKLLDRDLTSEKIDAYRHVIRELANPAVTKVENPEDNLRISRLFAKFPVYAFLQSGLDTNSSFALGRITPTRGIMEFMTGAIKEFTNNMKPVQLDKVYRKMMDAYSRSSSRNRYVDLTDDPSLTKSLLESPNIIYTYDSGKGYFLYDPSTITDSKIMSTLAESPDSLYVYYKGPGKSLLFGDKKVTLGNTLALTSLNSDKELEKNKLTIDQFVQNLKDLRDTGSTLTFSQDGYGQNLIGYSADGVTQKSKVKPGLNTFLYLSKELYNNFNYVNKNYPDMETPTNKSVKEPVPTSIIKVISGGQHGGDMGGLIGARRAGVETGGTAPPGWLQYNKGSQKELLQSYNLKEGEPDPSRYPKRTMKNVDDSDGTVAILWGPSVGTEKTIGYAQTHKWQVGKESKDDGYKPVLVIKTKNIDEGVNQLQRFLGFHNIKTLNVAGHRETSQPGLQKFTEDLIYRTLNKPKEVSQIETPQEVLSKSVYVSDEDVRKQILRCQ